MDGENPVMIRITGTSADAVAAMNQASEGLAQLIARSHEASEAATGVGTVLGSGGGGSGVNEGLAQFSARAREAAEAAGTIGRAIGGGGGNGIIGSGFTFGGLGGGLTGMFGALGEGIMGAVGHMGNFVSGWAQMQLALVGNEMFNAAAGAVRNFADSLFELNKATETNVYSWRYTYGQGMKPEVALANAQAISQWSQQFSYNIPFTRQDLMTSISGAAPLGLDLQGLQKYYPMIADLAATHINPMTGQPLDLGQAVMAIRGEMMGYSRMLKYQLNINPEELVPFGLAFQGRGIGGHITDMTTLLPALKAYSEKQGWTKDVNGQDQGAAFMTAHSTFWGEWSSWLDRLQNFELAGGEKMFEALKKDLEGISRWWDDHKDQMAHLADVFGTLLGKGVSAGGTVAQGVFQGLAGSGAGDTAMTNIQKLTDWFNDPEHQKQLHDLGVTIGTNLAEAGTKAGQAFGTLADGINRLNSALGGSKGDANIFQGLIDVLTFFPAELGRALQTWGDLINLINDIKNGDWEKAQVDLGLWLKDSGSTLGIGATSGDRQVTAHGAAIAGGGINPPLNPSWGGGAGRGQYGASLYGASPGSLLGGLGPASFGGFTGGASPFAQGQSWVQQIAAGVNAGKAQVHSAGQSIGDEIAQAVAQGLARNSASGSGVIAAGIKAIVQHEIALAEQSLSATPGAYFARGTYGGQY